MTGRHGLLIAAAVLLSAVPAIAQGRGGDRGRDRRKALLERFDKDGDGKLDAKEREAAREALRQRREDGGDGARRGRRRDGPSGRDGEDRGPRARRGRQGDRGPMMFRGFRGHGGFDRGPRALERPRFRGPLHRGIFLREFRRGGNTLPHRGALIERFRERRGPAGRTPRRFL